MDLPRPLVANRRFIFNNNNYTLELRHKKNSNASRTFASTTISSQESTIVVSALEQLVARLDYLAAPSSLASSQQRTAPITNATTNLSSSSKSVEEYARIICTGYTKLPPLKLGWIATHAVAAEHNNSNDWQDWVCPRSAMLFFLAQECGVPRSSNLEHCTAWNKWIQDLTRGSTITNNKMNSPPVAVLRDMRQAWTPKFESVIQCLLEQNSQQALTMLVSLRGDLLRLMTVLPKSSGTSTAEEESTSMQSRMQPLEDHLRKLLSTWFSPGMLETQRITFNTTSAGVIEKIAVKEAVHPMKSLDDLRKRLGPKRRVFALFHPLLTEEPLVILHVHLEANADTIPATMGHVLKEGDDYDESTQSPEPKMTPRIATFYSISNTQPGLTRGLGLGEFLIKQAVQLLQREFSSTFDTFVTLSPLPGFRKWIERIVEGETGTQNGDLHPNMIHALADARPQLSQLLQSTRSVDTMDDDSLHPSVNEMLEELRPLLSRLASHYLVLAKNKRSGKPLDPVAGFHIRNGAEVHRINFAADLSRKGLLRSLGVMANYRYRLDHVEQNKASFESSQYSQIARSESVNKLLER